MKRNLNSTIKLLFLFALTFIIFKGCSKDEPVETPVNNEPEETNIVLTEPINNGTLNISNPALKWNAFSGAVTYKVQLSTDANFLSPSIIDSILTATELTVRPGLLTTNVYYYWRVMANTGSGSFTEFSELRRFRIILAPPEPPVLLSPPNNSVNIPFLPLFDWNESATAETYRIQVSLNSAFIPVILDSANIVNTALQSPYFIFNTGTNYFWRVNASNSNGASTSGWSPVFTFRTAEGNQPSSISGRVTFADTNFIEPPYRYIVEVFKTIKWPPLNNTADYADTLNIKYGSNGYYADYLVHNIFNGSYHVTVTAQTRTIGNEQIYKSVYGCDTARVLFSNCALTGAGIVNIENGIGVNNINMLSWADSSKSIF